MYRIDKCEIKLGKQAFSRTDERSVARALSEENYFTWGLDGEWEDEDDDAIRFHLLIVIQRRRSEPDDGLQGPIYTWIWSSWTEMSCRRQKRWRKTRVLEMAAGENVNRSII